MRSAPLAAVLVLAAPVRAQESTLPLWVWTAADRDAIALRRSFELPEAAARLELWVTADNAVVLELDGERLADHDDWTDVVRVQRDEPLAAGRHELVARCRNEGGPAGMVLRLRATLGDGSVLEVVSDHGWQDRDGRPARVLGELGDERLPWTGAVTMHDLGLPVPAPPPQTATPARDVRAREGFTVERVFDVPRRLGSWVALCAGPDGELWAADEDGAGLFRVLPAALDHASSATTVHPVASPIRGAQGLCWLQGALYAVRNESRGSGLWRLRDQDGDGAFDDARMLRELDGGGEHGPHAVVPAPDGESLFVVAGNHTDPPPLQASRIPTSWAEDLLLPRLWDARGHARGRLAPGGWVAKVDPEGSRWEMWAIGLRNAYDLAFDADGDPITVDSDMEWDMGMPWYRPTRVCHLPSGAELGWRSGSGKWPPWYPDSLPPVLAIGPGSPTGLVVPRAARFPERYRRALLALDWTFGTIWALHLRRDGASWEGELEELVTGAPLPVADAAVGADGALYFVTGGRGTDSSLYRLRWDEEVATGTAAAGEPGAARRLRATLEAFHGCTDPGAVPAAWPHLDHADRFVRYAARIAVESQPVAAWAARALAEDAPGRALPALLALARCGTPEYLPALLDRLARIDLGALPSRLLRDALRTCAVALARLGPADAGRRAALAETLARLHPCDDPAADAELVTLLVHLGEPSVVPATVARLTAADEPEPPPWAEELLARNDEYGTPIRRMQEDMPPTAKLRLAFPLRHARAGWTPELRREYFAFLREAESRSGGESYRGFVAAVRRDALRHCPPSEIVALADVLEEAPRPVPPLVPARGPGRDWTVGEAVAALEGRLPRGDVARGRELFFAAACAACHRFAGEGGALGPDLTTVGRRLGVRDLLEAIVEPSKEISDRYGSSVVRLHDGSTLFGRVVEQSDDEIAVYPPDADSPPAVVAREAVAAIEESPTSQMPPGLVDPLSADELRDLVAYLLSAGETGDSR